MRILSISGENIASLAQPFCIDFTTQPLASAGLFAITGETGAGKSSILDAMCLALYGDAPRLSGGAAADEVPDPSGEAIKAKDSRAILRRGATQGWAEVRFTARDGQDYIARWQARRARDKADGRLQHVQRSVARATDGQVLANQTNAVTEQIEALTGFSYDEFRRTVLLAQGDFDSFLRADTNERAGLLEKVTGTGLYRAVSVRIFERTESAQQAYDALTQQRAGYQVLSVEDRSAMEAEVLALNEAGREDALLSNDVKVAIDRHTRLAETARLLWLAEDVERQALAAQTEAADERDWLSRIDRAAPLRAPWQSVQGAVQRLDAAQKQVETTCLAAGEAAAKAAEDQHIAALAETDFATKEAEFKAFGPIWDQAAALDSQITSAQSELESARARAITLEQDAKAERGILTSLIQEEGTARATMTEAEEKLASLSADCALADDWQQIAQRITDHAEAQQTLNRAEAAATKNGADVARLNQSLAELIALADKDRAAEVTLTEHSKELADQIAARELAHPSGRGGELAVLSSTLESMAQAALDYTAATTERAAAEADGKRAAQSVTDAIAQGAAATAALTVAEAQVTALAAPTEQAALAASDAARNMRLRLEPGAPCPVCGSCDHPTHADAAIADLAARLRSDLGAARQLAHEARNRQAEAHRACDRAQGEVDQAVLNIKTAESRITAAQDQWQKARAKALTITHCPDLPAHPDADPSHLFAISADIAEAQRIEVAAQADLTRLRRQLSDLASRRDTLLSTISGHARARDALNLERAEAEKLLALAAQEAEGAKGLVLRHTVALRPILEKLGEAADALDAPDLTTRLSKRVSVVVDLRTTRVAASTSLVALGPKIATAQSRVDSAQTQAREAQDGAETRQASLATLLAERASLLDGEATSLHRTRHNEARRSALAAQDAASKAQAASASMAAAAQARADTAEQEKVDAETAVMIAQTTLDATLAGSDLVVADLDALFAHPVEDVTAARQKLRALDDAVTSARATVVSRKVDSEAAQAGGVPEQPIEELAETLAKLDATAISREQRVGAINEEFRRDAATRAGLAGLDAEIEIAGKERNVWQAVNHAVGSRNGDRFARIAQSITLDVLVDHANQHLVDLNPRYRLRRAADLALQVEDRDMAGEARATRSLSGGERFLVSLALALALSRMGGKGGLVATLFIDEGFGSLDAGSLDLAIDALEGLRSQGRQVGVISHVEAMKDRIPTRITIRKQGGGKSVVEFDGLI
jgi:exonuclease SbcC